MPFIEALAVIVVFSRILGEISEFFGQPAMLGEIAAGVILGPSVLNAVHYTREIQALADLSVLLLVFLTGMDMELDSLWKAFRGRGSLVGISGFLIPMFLGIGVSFPFGLDPTRSVFMGLCIAITALPVSTRILMDMGKLQTEVGQKIISAAVFNDTASLLILGVILDAKGNHGTPGTVFKSMGLATVKVVGFMAAVVVAARIVRRYSQPLFLHSHNLFDRALRAFKGRESAFAAVLLFAIGFATLSQILGLQFIIGAFFGTMIFSYEVLGHAKFLEVRKTASDITMGFLGPIFFAGIGLEFQAASLRDWKLAAAVLAVAFVGKIWGGYAGGRLAGISKEESWALGVGLNGRGIMELVIANIALTNGFIGQRIFTILVLMAVVTTFATPFLLKRAYARIDQKEHEKALALAHNESWKSADREASH